MPMSRKRAAPKQKGRARRRTAAPRRAARTSKSVTTHSFVRKTDLFSVQGNAVHAPYQGVSNIQFGFLRNATEFGALYDQYKINFVKLEFWLKVEPGAQSATTAVAPKLYWYRDLDDAVIASQNEMRERSNMKIAVLRADRPVRIWVKPNLLNLVYRGTTTSSYVPVWNQFLDMTNTDVPHYGIKYNIDDLTNTNYRVDIETTYYFECKGTR